MSETPLATPQRVSFPGAHVVHPACAQCSHVHRFTEHHTSADGKDLSVTFDTTCFDCGCCCSESEYDDANIVPLVRGHLRALTGRTDGRTTIVAPSRFRLHQGARVGGSLQRPDSAERGLRNRIHPAGSNLAELGILGGAMAGHGEPAGSGRADALCPLRLVTLVESLCVWLGLIDRPCNCTPGEGCLRTGGECQ